ncbi:hypothetical protein JAAARDRAFT_41136 [Jaapia argillacea MUCL 33604]|uniref:Uncharacterized protein n=1 Tax=Jaapia argillacea MUCL 33604 TaxID=933084 RepID=A0A067P8R5_9AGAM|nr:hypothetical protein JAAARDRAFT_41136 [Jaapia argillacea MUCL 33604]
MLALTFVVAVAQGACGDDKSVDERTDRYNGEVAELLKAGCCECCATFEKCSDENVVSCRLWVGLSRRQSMP